MKKNKTLKRFLAFVLCAAMLVTYMPSAAFSFADDGSDVTAVEETTAAPTQEAKAEKPAPAASEPAQAEEPAPASEPEPAAEAEPAEEAAPAEETADQPAEEATEPESGEEAAPAEEPAEEVTEAPEKEKAKEETKLNTEAKTFVGKANSVNVKVVAPAGTFPEGTTMKVTSVAKSEVRDAVEGAFADEVNDFRAVDITFYADGKEVHPEKEVSVKLTTSAFETSEDLNVVHIEDSGDASVMDLTNASDTAAQFKTDGFSVYVVVETGEDARLKVTFIGADGNPIETEMINKRQIPQIKQYIFDPGAKAPEGAIFSGWTTEQNYDSNTKAKTIEDVRSDVEAKLNTNITDGTEIKYYAMFFKPYKVVYLDEHGVLLQTEQVLQKVGDTAALTHEVKLDYTPYPTGEEGVVAQFMGWQQVKPEISGTEKIYQVGDTITLTEQEYVLKAKTEKGHWFIFEENLSNASYTEPQFIPIGGKATRPTNPTRSGYTFDGWYTGDDSEARDGKVSGSAYDFNQVVTENTVVYGKWTAASTASYNVVFWFQKVSGSGYDYSGTTREVTGATVGNNTYTVSSQGSGDNAYARVYTSATAYTNYNNFYGFHLDHFDSAKEVTPEGTTVINVYYNRNTITYNFGSQSFSDRYGAPFTQWPDPGNNSVWQCTSNNMLLPLPLTEFNPKAADPNNTGNTVTFRTTSFSKVSTLYVYKQKEDGTWSYTNDYLIASAPLGNGGTWYPTETYVGFDISGYRLDNTSGSWTNVTNTGSINYTSGSGWGTTYHDVYLRYARKQYNITYSDGVFVDGSGNPVTDAPAARTNFTTKSNIYYEANINTSDYNIKPTLSGYVFLGWYDNELCAGDPYTFDKMPGNNVSLYAKWGHREYAVNLHPNDSTADPIKYTNEDQAATFYPQEGEKVGNVGGERIYYDLVGWYTDSNFAHAFNFDAIVVNATNVAKYGKLYSESEINPQYPCTVGELNLYANWRSKLDGSDGIKIIYDANGGSNAPVDNYKYVDKAKANAATASTSPDGNKDTVFSHWIVQKWNGSAFVDDVKVFPGETFTVLASNAKVETLAQPDADGNTKSYTIQVKAVYVEKDKEIKTFINWYNNYDGGLVAKSENIKINEATPIPAAPTREGYTFKGWIRGIEEDGTTTTLTDLWLTYENGKYYYNGAEATQVAADEMLVNDSAEPGMGEGYTKHHALYAKWEAIKYNIEFDKNADDATGTTAKMTDLEFDKSYNLTENGFTREGYVFKGWSTDKNATSATYTDKQSVKNLAKTDGETVTLYAIWLKKAVVDPSKTDFGLKNLASTTEDGKGHDFSFTLSAAEGTPMPASKTATVSYAADKTGVEKIPFGEIQFAEEGKFTYTITEDVTNYTKEKGWTVTNNGATVTVEVKDNGKGELTATVTPATIKNEYSAGEIIVDPKDTKTTFGKKNLTATTEDGKGHDFVFTLAPEKEDNPMPTAVKATLQYAAGEKGEKPIPFGEIKYTKAGTYTYTITEDVTNYTKEKGWTVTNSPATVTVTITDNGDGSLSAAVETATITNKYEASEITVDPKDAKTTFGKKNLTATTDDGKAHEFSFTLTPEKEGDPMPASAEAKVSYAAGKTGEQTIPFGEIKYSKAGIYKYTLSEDTTDYTKEKGWTVSNNNQTVIVTVTDNGDGTLSAAVETKTITNGYKVQEIIVDPTNAKTTFGKKNLTATTEDGKGHDFSFTLKAAKEGDPMPSSATAKVSYAAGITGEQTIPFGEITYTKAGTYTYTITEDVTNYTKEKGWTVTNSPATVTVTITDNGDGSLSAAVETATITNKYEASEITVDPKDAKTTFGKKNLTATTEDGKGHDFNFTLKAAKEGDPMPSSATAKVSYAAGKTGEETIPFGEIKYSKAGTYTYTITEDVTNYTKEKGWTVTNSPATVTVTITDNGDGTLSAAVETATITNKYEAAEITVDPKDAKTTFGKKNVTATTEDGKGHDFNFTLKAAKEGDPMPSSATAKVSYAAGKTGEETIPFGEITYSKTGTYTYTITEADPGKGWTVTGNNATVTVTITDNGDGTLSAAVETATITNKYEVGEITVDPKDAKTTFGKKNVTAAAADGKAKTFNFTLEAVTKDAPMPKDAKASLEYAAGATGEKTIPFGEITYTKAGDYTYKITEADAGKGWATTGSGTEITVTVTDNGDGTLSAKIDKTVEIENKYAVEDIIVDPTAAKTTFGKKNVTETTEDGKAKTFNFTLEAVTKDAPMPKDAKASLEYAAGATGAKTIPFGEITYSAAGEYEYKITEADPGKGWTVSNNGASVIVKITDNGDGTLSAAVENTPEIKNGYKVDEITVDPTNDKTTFGKKNVTATTADGKGHKFNFTLEAVTEGAPMPESAKASVSYDAAETGVKKIPFGEITYTKAGDYTYKITEADPGKGWTPTGNGAEVTVSVTDNGDGTMSAEVKTTPEIKNEYAVEEIKVDPKDAKTTFGKKDVKATTEDGKGHEFSFTLAKDGEAPMPASAEAKVSYEAAETGVKTIPFGEITYAAAGEYKYTITEADPGKGWTPTGNGATVTIKIKDNGDGTLSVESVDTKTIENKYAVEELIVDPTDAEAKTEFGKKNVTATTEDGKGKTFNFTLAKKGDAPMPTSEEASVSYEAGKTGEQTIPFGKITYTKPGEYKYTITEADAGGGWTTKGNKAEVLVTVTDNGDGTMSAVAETQTITNSYAVKPLEVDPTDAEAGTEFGKKNVTATTEDGKGKTFNFTLAKDGEAPMPESAEASVSYKAGETGEQTIPFGKITYTKPGEYKYTITEAEAGKGWTTTGNDAEVTVTVVDNGDGTMTASVAETAVVENSYKAEPVVVDDKDEEDNPIVKKIVEGEGFDATEFKFSIAAETAGAPLPEPAEGTVTAEEAGEFVVDFGAITFEKVGTYVYTIKETTEAPSRDWTCDNTEKTVRVVVTDDGEGQLHAKVEGVEVTNTYVELVDIIYHLNGGNWHGDPSDIVETYPVDTWIKIHAKPVREGYRFVEWRGSSYQPGDDYHVMAHHEFVAIWEKEAEPEEPEKSDKPDTGDHNDPLGALAGFILAGAGLGGVYAYRRRKEEE